MICANCKKKINLSFGKSGLNCCYCEDCAKSLGFFPNIETRPKNIQALTPDQHIVKHIHCDISQEFLKEYKAEIATATAKEIFDYLKGGLKDRIKSFKSSTIEFEQGACRAFERVLDEIEYIEKKYTGDKS